MKGYRRSRTDYPASVLAIYDNGGKTADRYTVVYEPYQQDGRDRFPVTGMSAAPFHPQGVCYHDDFRYRPTGRWGKYEGEGRCIPFEELPADCQRAIRQDLEEADQ